MIQRKSKLLSIGSVTREKRFTRKIFFFHLILLVVIGITTSTAGAADVRMVEIIVTVGNATWKSVEVIKGETTTLKPGWIEVNHASFRGHMILEAETGEEYGQVISLARSIALLPGEYLVTFGEIEWCVEVSAGETTTVNAGSVFMDDASYLGHDIHTKEGQYVGYVSNTASSFTLPPGEYTI